MFLMWQSHDSRAVNGYSHTVSAYSLNKEKWIPPLKGLDNFAFPGSFINFGEKHQNQNGPIC